MTETTTRPMTEETICSVTIEEDGTPIVRLIGQRLREAARTGHGDLLGQVAATVAVRSHDTPQVATIEVDRDAVTVTSGLPPEPDATVVVDLHARCTIAQEPAGDVALGRAVLEALRPPLPHWREAAERFWTAARGIPGVPDVLIVEAHGPEGTERGRFGVGETEYLMAGTPDLLAGVFSGADDLLDALAAGLRVKGTLSQLSVMTAASWKVRFDV